MAGEFEGKVVIVTGASRGVGLGIARRFLEEGASVASCSRRQVAPPAFAAGIPDGAERCVHWVCDQRDFEQIDSFVTRVVERFGRLDVLINNAGGAPTTSTTEVSPRFHKATIENNLTGPMWFALRAHRQMISQESGGSIVNISSQASGQGGSPTLVSYGAAKAGLNHLTKSLAKEWGPKIRVNCLSLGHVVTEMWREYIAGGDPANEEKLARMIPLKRFAQPEEVGDACLFLCSPRGGYINGATVVFDGGLT